jgi:hypothetical protein
LFDASHKPAHAGASVQSRSFTIPSGESGISLYMRNKHPADMTAFSTEKTVLLVRGSTLPSEIFDLPIDGVSMMDAIAQQGFRSLLRRYPRVRRFDTTGCNGSAIVGKSSRRHFSQPATLQWASHRCHTPSPAVADLLKLPESPYKTSTEARYQEQQEKSALNVT